MDENKNQEVRQPVFWATLPAPIRYDPELPAAAKLLYVEISSLTGLTGYCFARNEYFTELFGVSERTLQRQMNALQGRGYIRIEDGVGGKALRKIKVAFTDPFNAYPDRNDGVENPTPRKMTGPPDKNDGVHNNKINNNKPPKAPQGGRRVKKAPKKEPDYEPEMFARFWAAYPRGEDKQGAISAWDALQPDRELMFEMSAALSLQKASEEWKRGVGIPYAVRWLKNRRWEEVLDPDHTPQAATVHAPGNEEGLPWI